MREIFLTPYIPMIDRDLRLQFDVRPDADRIEYYIERGGVEVSNVCTAFSLAAVHYDISSIQTLRSNAALTARGASSDRDKKKFQNEARTYHQMAYLLSEMRDILVTEHGLR
jgi:hypothetical protein